MRITAKHKYVIGIGLLPSLNAFDLVVLEAVGAGGRVGILCCEDEGGSRFSYIGPVAALDGVPLYDHLDPARLSKAFPLYRSGWRH